MSHAMKQRNLLSSSVSTQRRQQRLVPVMLTPLCEKYFCAFLLGWIGLTAASSGEPITFSAMGCGPYTPPDKPAAAFYVRQENRERISEFMVHLGDVFKMPLVKKAE